MNTSYSEIFESQRTHFIENLKSAPISERKRKLKSLKNWILKNQNEICSAIHQDFKKPDLEVRSTEIYPCLSAIRHSLKLIDTWAAKKRVDSPISYLFTKSYISMEPKGVSLIISPWNYPFFLAMEPVIAAISAGCTVILKPSEHSQKTSELISKLAGDIFNTNELCVFQGDHIVSQELLKLPVNHIYFTGSPQIGKLVMEAASKNLTSVTLELGGTNPAVIDSSSNLRDAAEKILWAKCMSAGQSCVSINQIFIASDRANTFIKEVEKAKKRMYGKFIPGVNMASIINTKHYKRLKSLISESKSKGSKVVFGGDFSDDELWMGPTFIANVPDSDPLKTEEIFGPIVTLTEFTELDQVIRTINNNDIPLSAYIFSKSSKNIKNFCNSVQSGGFCVNDTTLHVGHPDLPFGGQNTSGIGKGHGIHGFLEFTNQRSVLKQRTGLTMAKLIYPPYSKKWKTSLIQILSKWF